MTVHLDGQKMTDRAALHDMLKEALCLPDYYGRNLDAFSDLLGGKRDLSIVVRNFSAAKQSLGGYAEGLRHVLLDAARDNPNITVEFL